ncbi:MAG: hypothetical protein EOP46_12140 [Sphingobacteriaceae bacterium]|nr:MAG: hypothetical protein EOP46_12140 [Sphingobacteriaceae bacterium]
MKKYLLLIFLFIATAQAYADTIAINHFTVVQNPFAEDEVAIQATDTALHVREEVNGVFTFSMNGFEETLQFDKGTAFYRHKIQKSTFLYAKHVNDNGTHSNLFYIYRNSGKLMPIHISWIWLLIIPCALVLLGYMFKRFIIIAVVIFVIFFYFNHANNLSVGRFFENIVDGLKGLF